ncbi:MAG: lysophospholipid acyltransferase family protein [Clostridia bacterium]|nr:lysophospholipid acyltransferase family protein [Clostridia bacterium]
MRKEKKGYSLRKFAGDIARVCGMFFLLFYQTKKYYENGKKSNLLIKGGAVVISNHRTFKDPIVISVALWRRRLRYFVAESVMNKPFRSTLMRGLGCIRIDRNIFDFEAVKKGIEVLKNDELLVVFPEGALNKTNDIAPFKSGCILMAAMAKVPITPFYIDEAHKGKKRKVAIGEPIDCQKYIAGRMPTGKEIEQIGRVLYEKENILKSLID